MSEGFWTRRDLPLLQLSGSTSWPQSARFTGARHVVAQIQWRIWTVARDVSCARVTVRRLQRRRPNRESQQHERANIEQHVVLFVDRR